MSHITEFMKAGLLLLAGMMALSGCSSSTENPRSVFNTETQQHQAGWMPAGHKTTAQADLKVCAECHGSDYLGGISKVSCTKCHLGGVNAVHPQDWGQQASTKHAAYAAILGASACANANCHGAGLGGISDSGPSCTKCHIDAGSKHPAIWGQQTAILHAAYVATGGNSSCAIALCHGADLTGGVTGPSCSSCHLGGPAAVHPADWSGAIAPQHKAYVTSNSSSGCANAACHGPTLGGVTGSGPACSSCHLGGVSAVHPSTWTTPVALSHAPAAQAIGTTSCANALCHGAALDGVANSGPSCLTTCHLGSATATHPASWGSTTQSIDLNHAPYIVSNGAIACKNNYCHGSSLAGVIGSGPACSTSSCHQNGSPLTLTGCASCHGKPPTGTVAPNRAAAHTAHSATVTLTDGCNVCHNGAGTGAQKHFNGAVDALFLSAYSAKTGAAAYDPAAGTCSKASCHGGQTTPAWPAGTIDVNAQCSLCHTYGASAGTPEYNSFYSGHHNYHVNTPQQYDCTACHDVTKLAQNHFTFLNTSAMEGPAQDTVGGLVSSYTATFGNCANDCHATRQWFNPSTTQP